MTTRDASAVATAHAWLTEMQSCVQAVDYDRAKALFHSDVVGFGTYAGVLEGLDNLVAGQWANIWPTIRDFTFDLAEIRATADGDLLWAACPWDSLGTRPDGTTFPPPRPHDRHPHPGTTRAGAHSTPTSPLYPPTATR
ncbi:MAG: nuclear transport factor 2 family protein [Thermomicrobiales bacterium]